jgi:hypothetical protein
MFSVGFESSVASIPMTISSVSFGNLVASRVSFLIIGSNFKEGSGEKRGVKEPFLLAKKIKF